MSLAELGGRQSLDSIFSLACEVEIPPGGQAELAFLTGASRSRGRAVQSLESFRSMARVRAAFDQARLHSQVQLQSLGLDPVAFPNYQRLLSAVLNPFHDERPGPADGVENPGSVGEDHATVGGRGTIPPGALPPTSGGQESLWSLGVSGDLPILLVRATRADETPPILEILRVHAYWEGLGIQIDLIVLDEEPGGYAQTLRHWLVHTLNRLGRGSRMGQPGGVHYVPADQAEARVLEDLLDSAAVVLRTDRGSMADQLGRLEYREPDMPPFVPVSPAGVLSPSLPPIPAAEEVGHPQALGGFSRDGRTYALRIHEGEGEGAVPPAPWINVMANPRFGTLVSETGSGFTWVDNSGESRLTGWSNDPVLDPPSEALYVRDEETGVVISATPSASRGGGPVEVHHGLGWSRFRSREEGLEMDLRLFVARDLPVRLATLTVENLWDHPRRLTVTQYVEWVMGTHRDRTASHLITDIDRDRGILFAWNPFSSGSENPVGLLASTLPLHGATCDRIEFLGDGGLLAPDGLRRLGLARRCGRGLDPCGALQVHMDLPSRSSQAVTFFLGSVADPDQGRALVTELRGSGAVTDQMDLNTSFWEGILGRLQVSTPAPEMDLMVNGWLLYQTLSCRVWGRSGLYQSSGAFGFRDQLQDVLALLGPAPRLAREHILTAARHQFPEGDVLHWWHPDSERGVRTRCSDDLLWLPFTVASYLEATGDRVILDEPLPFLSGAPLRSDETARFGVYLPSEETSTLFDHCVRALRHGLRTGPQGLPLIGSGDWNDSLDSLGEEGRGESVWLAWFIFDIARRWSPICAARGEPDLEEWLRESAASVAAAAEEVAWDGSWYRRATFDDGVWVGTSAASEGKIDSLTQSWALLSGGARPGRARTAMDSVLTHLVDPDPSEPHRTCQPMSTAPLSGIPSRRVAVSLMHACSAGRSTQSAETSALPASTQGLVSESPAASCCSR
jgi:cyclic beta-1,2-glucan synthetase